ncbi:hypothetical protein N0V90_013093 [Kalmusia sp. IMI 367209]|nr:hypothetical protein N0V90_013093 [Kalmusia sp. IMI 367209]
MLVLGFVLFIAFIIWDARFAKKPFIPYKLIKQPTVVAACVLCMLDFFHYSVFSVFFPSYLQIAGHFTPGRATRIEAKIWVLVGVPLLVLGQGLQIYLVNIDGQYAASEPAFVTAKALAGVGRGFYQTAAQVTIQAVVPREDVGIVTAVFFASMNLGGAIGTSVSGAIWRGTLPSKLTSHLPSSSKGLAMAIFKSIVVAQKYSIGSEIRNAIDQSYRESQKVLAIAATVALVPMLGAMWLLNNVDLVENREDQATSNKEEEESKSASKQ